MAVAVAWDARVALAYYRATLHRISDWYDAADPFDRPSRNRPDLCAADAACQAAFHAHDQERLRAALACYEHAITGRD